MPSPSLESRKGRYPAIGKLALQLTKFPVFVHPLLASATRGSAICLLLQGDPVMDRRAMDESFITDSCSSVGDPEVSVGAPLMAAQARRMMPLQTKSLRDYEEHLIKLERENLHLRLRHFYMQQQKDPEAGAGTAEFEAFKSEMLGDVDRLTKEIGERNALLQKTWLTVEQQHDAIEQLKQEKADLEKELHKFQSKTSFAEAVHDDNVKMANNVSQVQRQNKQLESEVKALKMRLQELENVEAPSMRHQLDKKILALKNLSTVVTRQEDVIEALRSQQALLSSIEPMTEAFLQRIEDALASKDIQGALLAKDKFRRDLGNGLKGEMLLLSSNLESCQERCRDLESEIERSSQMHMRICTEKDKLLESVQFRVQELENSAQELLSERNAAALETERSFQDLLRSLKQKDDLVDQLQTKLTCATEKAAAQVPERIGTHKASGGNLIDLSLQGTAGAGENATQEMTAEQILSPLRSPTNAEDGLSDNLATELDELCSIIRDLGRQAGLFSELSTVNGEQSGIAKALKDALKDARDRGLCVALLPTQHEVNDKENGTPADCKPCSKTQLEPRDTLLLSTLGEKLKQVCNLFAIEKTLPESGRDWSAKDVMDHVELILEKAKQWTADSGNASFDLRKSHEVSLQESMEKLRGVVRWLQDESSRNHSDIASFQEAVLSDLNPALECIAVLRDEVDTLCASWRAQDGSGKRCSSVDELVYAVNLSGRLVPVESSLETTRHGEKSSKDVSQQTSNADVDIETLKSDLSKSRAQAKKLHSGDLLVEINNKKQSEALLKLNTILDVKVSVSPHRTLNTIRGVLSEDDFLHTSEEELLEGLQESRATQVSPEVLEAALRAPLLQLGQQCPPPPGGSARAASLVPDRSATAVPVRTSRSSSGEKGRNSRPTSLERTSSSKERHNPRAAPPVPKGPEGSELKDTLPSTSAASSAGRGRGLPPRATNQPKPLGKGSPPEVEAMDDTSESPTLASDQDDMEWQTTKPKGKKPVVPPK
ncbi:hypothetical protein HPB47_018439 [Ixodes persulcatus]|uniref:Uncharacterized protein n=1 Tax=Ixodes persulcatus TaxID=34615 RepID=A0AC60QKP7_IXOPE|nr:hypothetical protein HPB47_018439 [Ixodes persulcatus]